MNGLIKYHRVGSGVGRGVGCVCAGTVGTRRAEWLKALVSFSLAPATGPFPAKTWASFVQGQMHGEILPSGLCFPSSTPTVKRHDVAIFSRAFILFSVHVLRAVGQVLFSVLCRSPTMLTATL